MNGVRAPQVAAGSRILPVPRRRPRSAAICRVRSPGRDPAIHYPAAARAGFHRVGAGGEVIEIRAVMLPQVVPTIGGGGCWQRPIIVVPLPGFGLIGSPLNAHAESSAGWNLVEWRRSAARPCAGRGSPARFADRRAQG